MSSALSLLILGHEDSQQFEPHDLMTTGYMGVTGNGNRVAFANCPYGGHMERRSGTTPPLPQAVKKTQKLSTSISRNS